MCSHWWLRRSRWQQPKRPEGWSQVPSWPSALCYSSYIAWHVTNTCWRRQKNDASQVALFHVLGHYFEKSFWSAWKLVIARQSMLCVYLSRSLSFAWIDGNWSTCGVAQTTWFLQYLLNQFPKAMSIPSDDVGTKQAWCQLSRPTAAKLCSCKIIQLAWKWTWTQWWSETSFFWKI